MELWIIWILFTLIVVVIETTGRYVRFKREPAAWTTGVTVVRAMIWSGAWLFVAWYSGQGLTAQAVAQSLLFGLIYLVSVLMVGRAVRARIPADQQ